MKKRILAAWVLALSLFCTMALPAQASAVDYKDTENHYARKDIEIWSGHGVLRGYPDGSFQPDGALTRAELAVVLDRIMGYRETAENRYPDLPEGKWYAGSILRLAAQGIYTGDKGGRMNPNAPITRQEAFVTLGRFLQMEERGNAPGFADDAAIGGWAKGYIAAMGEAGYITGDNLGRVRPGDPITRAEVVVLLSRMIGGFVGTDGVYSRDCEGNMVVNAQNVTLKDMVIEGNLIVAEGVAEGDVYLDRVTVKGDVILRGCGENSFHIMPGCQVKSVIVTKTTGGRIRLVNEMGETIPMIFVNDGVGGVTLDGGAFDSVVVACDAPVAVAAQKVGTLSVTGNAQVTVEKNAAVARVEVGDTAPNAQLTVNGKVTALVNDAGAAVTNRGTIGPGSSSGSSSSGGSSSGGSTSGSGSGSGSGSTQKEIPEVSLQLLAPRFGEIPDTADVLGVGYTARTVWFNGDGSPASYRWKASGSAEDTFTADQAYQAVITLAPVSGYRFADDLRVKVTDGKDTPTSYSPAQVTVSGGNRVVTMVYEKTEDRDPVSGVSIVAPLAVDLGETAELQVSYWDNFLVDPATYTYQWYRCSGGDGSGKTPIAGAVGREYTIPAEDTQSEGNLYYCCDVMAMGRTCPSGVRGVEVHDTLDLDTVPVPTFGAEALVMGDGWIELELNNLLHHKDMAYEVTLTAEIYKKDGDLLYNGVSGDRLDYDRISDDGHARWAVDMTDLVKDALFAMLNAGFSYDVEIKNVLVVVHPLYKGNEIPEKVGDRWYDMTWEGRGSFHVFTAEDEDWQGPPKDLQLVIRASEGTFADKNDPERDPVPVGQYDHVKASFRMKSDWVEGIMEGIYEYGWDGELYIPYHWRDGFETGQSTPEVMCLFYTGNSSEGGMNVYAMKLTSLNIIFRSENE